MHRENRNLKFKSANMAMRFDAVRLMRRRESHRKGGSKLSFQPSNYPFKLTPLEKLFRFVFNFSIFRGKLASKRSIKWKKTDFSSTQNQFILGEIRLISSHPAGARPVIEILICPSVKT